MNEKGFFLTVLKEVMEKMLLRLLRTKVLEGGKCISDTIVVCVGRTLDHSAGDG